MTKSFKKIISLLLIIGMNWSAVSLIAGTDACFNDVEISENNTLTAGVLDFSLSGNGFHAYGSYYDQQTQTERIEVINTSENLDFKYSVSARNISGGAFCDDLVLSVDFNGANIYSGSLSDLENDPDALNIPAPLPSIPDEWDFQITNGSSENNKTCEFDFVFQAYQENLSYGNGFFDEEKVGNVISTMTDCGPADYVVINEVQVAGATATDEFVELYNPTNLPISLNGWRLSRKVAAGNEYNLLTSFPNLEIPAYGYFLIVHKDDYVGSVAEDIKYSTTQSIAADNTVILYSDAGNTVVDKVGYGVVVDYETVGDPITAPYPNNPPNDQSIERGLNGYDSDDNSADFIIKTDPTPTNSIGDGMPEIVINEFLATGVVYDDFIEIYNNSNVDLEAGWWIRIEKKGMIAFFETGSLPYLKKGEFEVVYTTIYFGMDVLLGDGIITIYDNSNNEIDKISYYGATATDSSFARIPDGLSNWIDPIPTPKGTNEIEENLRIAGLDDLIEGDGGGYVENDITDDTDGDGIPDDASGSTAFQDYGTNGVNSAPEPIIPEPITESESDDPEDDDTDDGDEDADTGDTDGDEDDTDDTDGTDDGDDDIDDDVADGIPDDASGSTALPAGQAGFQNYGANGVNSAPEPIIPEPITEPTEEDEENKDDTEDGGATDDIDKEEEYVNKDDDVDDDDEDDSDDTDDTDDTDDGDADTGDKKETDKEVKPETGGEDDGDENTELTL
jgi:hypothetical protein